MMKMILLQIDFSQAEAIQTYALGSLVLVLIAGVIGMVRLYTNERNENKQNQSKMVEVMGELREVVRNNTEALNKVKEKL